MGTAVAERNVLFAIERAQKRLSAMKSDITKIQRSGMYSDAHKAKQIAEAREAGRRDIRNLLTESREKLAAYRQRTESAITEARQVDPAALSIRALTLKPVLDAAPNNPAVLLTAYREHHTDPAARRLLEDFADALRLTMNEGERMQFEMRWTQLHRELASNRPATERVAVAELQRVSELERYVSNAALVIEHELADGDPASDRGARIKLASAQHAVRQFERAQAS